MKHILMNISRLICFSLLISSIFLGSVLPVSAEDGDLVYVDVPLTWYEDTLIDYDTGWTEPDDSCSVTDFLKVIEGARYDIIFSYSGSSAPVNTTVAFYYNAYQEYLGYEGVWVDSTSYDHFVTLTLPSNCSYIRLSNDLQQTSDNEQQQQVRLRIYVQASYIEEHDVVEETLQDVVYRDDSTVIDDASDKLTQEFETLHEQEDFLLDNAVSSLDGFFGVFNWSILAEYTDGFRFIGTWFSNFFNADEAIYTMLTMGSAIIFIFVLFRFKGH